MLLRLGTLKKMQKKFIYFLIVFKMLLFTDFEGLIVAIF